MSGGHWNYLAHRLQERAEYGYHALLLLAALEHELDWGESCDSCLKCAELRCMAALKVFFDGDGTDSKDAIEIAQDRSRLENACPKCQEWIQIQQREN